MKIVVDIGMIFFWECFFEVIVQSVIDYVIIFMDFDGFVISWNEGVVKIFGWKVEDMIGKLVMVFFMQEDRENGVLQKEMIVVFNWGWGNDE